MITAPESIYVNIPDYTDRSNDFIPDVGSADDLGKNGADLTAFGNNQEEPQLFTI